MSKVADIIKGYAGKTTGVLGVGYKNLLNGDEFYLNGDTPFPSASVFKVPVLIELFNRVDKGEISLDSVVELTEDSFSVGSGLLSKLSPGIKLFLRDYATLMMIISDNTATDYIVRLLGKDSIRAMIASMGIKNTTVDYTCNELILAGWNKPIDSKWPQIRKYMEEGEIERNSGMYRDRNVTNNWTTPWDMTEMFSQIYHHKILTPKACDEMMGIMERCDTNRRLPYFLPKAGPNPVKKVIHKTGTLFKLANDAGIIVSEKQTYVLSVFYNGFDASDAEKEHMGVSFGERLIAEMSRDVYAALH